MVQELQVLRCYSCNTFQGQIVKKVQKWQCKICNEKQSVQKVYYQGSGQDCRLQVQYLNFIKHIKDEQESEVLKRVDVIEDNDAEEGPKPLITHSKWTKYLIEPQKEFHDDTATNENKEVEQLSSFHSTVVVQINEQMKETETKKRRCPLYLRTNVGNDLTASGRLRNDTFNSKNESLESSGLSYQTAEYSSNSSFSHPHTSDDNDNENNRSSPIMRNNGKRKFDDDNTIKSWYKSDNEIEFISQSSSLKRTKFTDKSSIRKQNLYDIIKTNRSESGRCLNSGTEKEANVRKSEPVVSEINESLVTKKLILPKPNIRKITIFESDDNLENLDF